MTCHVVLYQKQRGSGILEVVLVGVLISVLMVVFMGSILNLSVAIERETMHQTLNNLNSALNIEALTLIVQNKQEAIAEWEGGNPMILIDPPPVQYKGSFPKPDPKRQTPGSWFFDEEQSLLIYRINNIEQFGGGRAIPERVRFKVQPMYDDLNEDGFKNDDEHFTGLRLEPLDQYQWVPERNDRINN
jgi:hypothetical protein